MRYQARKSDITALAVLAVHARDCSRAAYRKDFPVVIFGVQAVAGVAKDE